jgi:hypothetical protein
LSWQKSPFGTSLLAQPASGEPVPSRACLFSLYGKAALDEREIDDLIAFLATLEDGWGARTVIIEPITVRPVSGG